MTRPSNQFRDERKVPRKKMRQSPHLDWSRLHDRSMIMISLITPNVKISNGSNLCNLVRHTEAYCMLASTEYFFFKLIWLFYPVLPTLSSYPRPDHEGSIVFAVKPAGKLPSTVEEHSKAFSLMESDEEFRQKKTTEGHLKPQVQQLFSSFFFHFPFL